MGVLDIAVRRERLGNLGGVQAVRTDDGSVRAAGVVADAMRRAAAFGLDAARENGRIGQQYGKAIADLGSGVVRFVEAADAYVEERDRRREDAYANKYTAAMLAHNQGDGKDVLGAMNETIKESDDGEWMRGNAEAAKKIHESVLKDMGLTDEDFRDSRMQKWRDAFLFKQNAQWLGKRNAAMTAYADREAEAKYQNDRNDVTDDMVSEDGWKNISASMERLIERKGWGPEQAKAFCRKEAKTICGIGIKKDIDATTAEAVAAGEDGGAEFDKLIERWEKNLGEDSLLPPASWIVEKDASGKDTRRNPLKEWLTGADMKSLKEAAVKDAKDAKAKWRTAMDAALAEERRATVDAANRSIIEVYTGNGKDGKPLLPPLDESDPHSVDAHYATLSRALEAIGTDPKLVAADSAMAAGLVKSANAMAQKGRRDAQKLVDQRTEQVFLEDYEDPVRLGWMTAEGFQKMTPGEAIQRAIDAHAQNKISDATYTKCLRACSKAVDSQNQEFLDAACEAIGYSCPGIFSSRNGKIDIYRSQLSAKDRRNPEAAKTGVKRVIEEDGGLAWFDRTEDVTLGPLRKALSLFTRWFDRTEDVTLGQLRKALSLFTRQIVQDEKDGTWNEQRREEYLQKFKELVKPTVEDWQKRKLQERLDEIDDLFGQPRSGGGNWTDDIRLGK